MKEVAREQLPTSLFFSSEISLAPFFQRTLSPESELMRVSAVVIFFFFVSDGSDGIVFNYFSLHFDAQHSNDGALIACVVRD